MSNDIEGVLDASVLLAAMLGEIDDSEAAHWLANSCISAVNLSETIAKLAERGYPRDFILAGIADFEVTVEAFEQKQAIRAGLMRPVTRAFGLSFADRACLALAAELGRPAVTADRAWARLDLGVEIKLVR